MGEPTLNREHVTAATDDLRCALEIHGDIESLVRASATRPLDDEEVGMVVSVVRRHVARLIDDEFAAQLDAAVKRRVRETLDEFVKIWRKG